jgi:hypothetical protein
MPQYQGVWNLQDAARLQSTQQWVTDPQFKQTTLLLQGDSGANGAQNNTFYDTSPNQFAITRNGNTTQGSFTPFSCAPTAWGNYFNGSTDYLTTSNANFAMGTSNFTVECWVYLTAYPTSTTTDGYIATWLNNSGNGFWLGTDSSTGKLAGYVGQGASADGFSAGVVPLNTWNHVALTRNGSTLTVWLNGVSLGTASTTRSLDRTPLAIGSTYAGLYTYKTTGYITNARVISGQCLYTGTFFPSMAPLTTTSVGATGPGAATSITGTVTLLTCQSNRFIDNSASANTLTVTGTPSVQPFSPFAPQYQWTSDVIGGSGYFDGTGDYLYAGNNAAFTMGTGDFTYECWAYHTSISGQQTYFARTNGNFNGVYFYKDSSGYPGVYTTAQVATSSVALTANQWYHLVATRASGTLRIFVNGVQTASVANSTNMTESVCYVGGDSNGTSLITGYISGARILKGTGYSSITVPTAPPTAITNTSLLLNFTNAGIYDGTMKNDLETVGDAKVSTSVVKYGSGSMYFDGSGDYLVARPSQNFVLGTADFTVEFWLYLNAYPSTYGAYFSTRTGSTGMDIQMYNNAGTYQLMIGNPTGAIISANNVVPLNTWTYITATRQNGFFRLFVNGIIVASGASSQNFTDNGCYVGTGVSGNNTSNCYMDDVRVTLGLARYIANFTPPQVALPRQ